MRGEAGKGIASLDLRRPTSRNTKVNIERLKTFALDLPKGSMLRDLLLTEDDEMDVDEFIAKMDVWLKLVSREPS